jgi:hypothetical protein
MFSKGWKHILYCLWCFLGNAYLQRLLGMASVLHSSVSWLVSLIWIDAVGGEWKRLFVGIPGKNYSIYCTFFNPFLCIIVSSLYRMPTKNFILSERYRKQTRCTSTIIFTADDEVLQFVANNPAVTNFENHIWRRQESRTKHPTDKYIRHACTHIDNIQPHTK